LNNNKKSLQTSNANQLFFIIDFLIDYVKSREKIYKEKVNYNYKPKLIEISNENSVVKSSNSDLDSKNRKLQEIISKNNISDIDDLVVTTKNKKEGFFESKSSNKRVTDTHEEEESNSGTVNYLGKKNAAENNNNGRFY
jgi:hypothetical protein